MPKFSAMLKKAAFLAVALLVIPLSVAGAVAPNPFYGTANVDGNGSEWSANHNGTDFFGYTYWVDDSTRLKAEVYVRYDCATSTLYVRVRGYDGTVGDQNFAYKIDADSGTANLNRHFVILDGVTVVQGSTGDNNSAPDFAYYGVNNSDPDHGSVADGWEASLPNVSQGTHQFQVGTRSAVIGTSTEDLDSLLKVGSPNYVSLTIDCSVYDWGDLPSNYAMVTSGESGANHKIGNIYLGTKVDSETTGVHNASALGDDNANQDDEDGVQRTPGVTWHTGANGGSINVLVTGTGCLFGWMDWNNSGGFGGTNEVIINGVLAGPGLHTYTFTIPAGTSLVAGVDFFGRFRLYPTNAQGNCSGVTGSLTGTATNGEVEDHVFDPGGPTAVTITSLTARGGATALPIAMAAGGLMMLVSLAFVLRRQR